jgi:hypothetical protein
MAVVPRKQISSVSIVIAPTGMGSVVKNRSVAELNLEMQTWSAYHVVRTASAKIWSAWAEQNIQWSE